MAISGRNKRRKNLDPNLLSPFDAFNIEKYIDPNHDWSQYSTLELLACRPNSTGVELFEDADIVSFEKFKQRLYEELAKRPHIRNVPQAREERKRKQQAKQNR